jgi:hypothetical protein
MPFRRLTQQELDAAMTYDRFNGEMVFVAGADRFPFKKAPSTTRFRPQLKEEAKVVTSAEMRLLLAYGGAYIEIEVPEEEAKPDAEPVIELPLTELDPTETYVDHLGRQWACVAGYWRTPSIPVQYGLDTDVLRLFPDLKLYTPEWWEELVKSGPWVKVKDKDMVSAINWEGDAAFIEWMPAHGEFRSSRWIPDDIQIQQFGTLQECIDAVGPLAVKP